MFIYLVKSNPRSNIFQLTCLRISPLLAVTSHVVCRLGHVLPRSSPSIDLPDRYSPVITIHRPSRRGKKKKTRKSFIPYIIRSSLSLSLPCCSSPLPSFLNQSSERTKINSYVQPWHNYPAFRPREARDDLRAMKRGGSMTVDARGHTRRANRLLN